MLTTRTRRITASLVGIFVVYAVLASPDQSADVVRNAWSQLGDGVGSVGEFFDALLQG
ncbi:MAG: hypothetical protein QG608_1932 [Actinomycetota bacterium]|nr:hypothetical protein [Actinomycetota bacterium]